MHRVTQHTASPNTQRGAPPLTVNGFESERDRALSDPEVDDRTGLRNAVTGKSNVN